MKSVLISIKPQWCKLIANGKKTIEVRKTKPKIEPPFKCYIYCTKGKPIFEQSAFCNDISNGKVIGEFVCENIETIDLIYSENLRQANSKINEILKNSCLSAYDLLVYLSRDKTDKNGYAWYISNLVVYDKPMELSEFFYACDKPKGTDCSVCLDHRENKCKAITRPPQSWCYVEERSEE